MDLLILSFGELSETNMVRIVMIMNFISFLAECWSEGKRQVNKLRFASDK